MKSTTLTTAGRTRKAFKSIKRAARLTLVLALVAQCLPFGGASRAVSQVRTTASTIDVPPLAQVGSNLGQMPSEPIAPIEATIVSFKELSAMLSRNTTSSGTNQYRAVHSPGTRPEPGAPAASSNAETPSAIGIAKPMLPEVASPAPSQSFLAQEDSPRVGTGTFTIPPDTMGAVGLDKVFTQTNGNFRVHNKLTGAPLSTVSAETFWSPTGATGVFDPRIVYDPYQNRWITAIVSNANSASSSVLVGVSNTSDPEGTWQLFRVPVGFALGSGAPFASGGWADFPMLGFNKNWVAIGYNMHAITNSAFVQGEVIVLNYPNLRAGTLGGSRLNLGANFCIHPATTLSPTENTLYLLEHASSAAASLIAYTISGTPSAPAVNQFGLFTRPGGGWVEPIGDLLPQNCVPGSPVATFQCPPTPRKLETSDSQIRGNVVFRNGKLWYSQTVGIDLAGGDPVDHTAAQWTAVTPTFTPPSSLTMTFNDGGRVEDATATATNGGKWYAYSSIAVNRNDDVMFGFSEFESDDFVDAGYTFRAAADAAGTMRDTHIYKDGEDYYDKDFGTGRNRFGDYSHAVVDPVNDTDLWTVQEYTQPRVVGVPPSVNEPANGLGSNSSRWSTWWAKIALANPGALGDLVISEYRLRGTGGAEDEFIEIYNKTDSDITVTTTDGSTGYALAASDGIVRFTIPNGTVIPAHGHYLGVNSDGYSLATYPAGVATTANGDITYTTDIADLPSGGAGCTGTLVSGRGIALFNTATVANFSTTTRFDAAGSVCETNTLYKEGTGHAVVLTFANTQNAWVRDQCGKSGNAATVGGCPSNGATVDAGSNATDFFFVEVDGLPLGPTQRLGAPGPENLFSPIYRTELSTGFRLDQTKYPLQSPNTVRTQAPTPESNDTFGTLELRRRIVNNTGEILTRLRFRIIDITTFPPVGGSGRADLRALTSTDLLVGPINDSTNCGALQAPPSTSPTQPCSVTARGLTLETPPLQPNGGGYNASLSADSVTISPLAPGQSINVRILLGVQAIGDYRLAIVSEGLTPSGKGIAGIQYFSGHTDNAPTAALGTISGAVTTANGEPLAGVTMRLSGAMSAAAITDANGNYSFDNVETMGFYTVTPSRPNYGFSPGSLSFSQLGSHTEAGFTGVASNQNRNPLETPEYFVRQHYLDFLGREPDEVGFNFWSDQILECGGNNACIERRTINVSAAYFLSVEFQRTGGLVDRLYRASYGRNPRYAEFMPDRAMIARDVVVGRSGWEAKLAGNEEAFVDNWVTRPAFHTAFDGLSNTEYVDRLLSNTGVNLAQIERASLVKGLGDGGLSRADVLLQIAGNENFAKARFNEAFVMMEYFGYLRRDPDASGYQFWLQKLNQFDGNFERAEMVKAFINSGEYRARFQP